MIKGEVKKKVLEKMFDIITPYDVYKTFMPYDFHLNECTYSPFANESHPSFIIGEFRGKLQHKDFARPDFKGNCIAFVGQLMNITDFMNILKEIDSRMNLGIFDNIPKIYERSYLIPPTVFRPSIIQFTARKFTKIELAYWNEYYQDISDLKKENIYSISKCWYNKKLFDLGTDLRFAYVYEDRVKIYRPFADKKEKWRPNNTHITDMDGLVNLNKDHTAAIQKSKKDYMVVKKIYPYTCGVQNEGTSCFGNGNVEYIKENSKSQFLMFDADKAGVEASKIVTNLHGFGYINVPHKLIEEGIKDFAEYARIYGLKTVEKYLKSKGLSND